MRKKILILGASGMLGSTAYRYFVKNSKYVVDGTARDTFDVYQFIENPNDFSYLKRYAYIINCIGILRHRMEGKKDFETLGAIAINSYFPHVLSNFCKKSKVIHVTSDAVFSGKKGMYTETDIHDATDAYGKTKSLGEVKQSNVLNIRCSIIGPEVNNKKNLLSWFLNQKEGGTVKGYFSYKWNGVTTLQFAELCLLIIENNLFSKLQSISPVHHFTPNKKTTKYHLLLYFKKVFDKKIKIKKYKFKPKIDLTLASRYSLLESLYGKRSLEKEIQKLKRFMLTKHEKKV